MIWIGIDPGTETGLAVWDGRGLTELVTLPLHRAMEFVRLRAETGDVTVLYEDAHLRQFIPLSRNWSREIGRAIGAGHVMRDCNIWDEYLTDLGIEHHAVAPKDNVTKVDGDTFKRVTGWTQRTNEHCRDAAGLVDDRLKVWKQLNISPKRKYYGKKNR